MQLKLVADDIVELQIAEDQLNLTNLRQILLVDGIVGAEGVDVAFESDVVCCL